MAYCELRFLCLRILKVHYQQVINYIVLTSSSSYLYTLNNSQT